MNGFFEDVLWLVEGVGELVETDKRKEGLYILKF